MGRELRKRDEDEGSTFDVAQLVEVLRKHPVIVLLSLAGVVVGSLAGIVNFGSAVVRGISNIWTDDTEYAHAYEDLRVLDLGSSPAFVKERYGSPWRTETQSIRFTTIGGVIERKAKGRLYGFRAPGHTVSLLTTLDGRSVALGVSTCTPEFRGDFPTPVGELTLNETTMADFAEPHFVDYVLDDEHIQQDQVPGDLFATHLDIVPDVVWGRYYTCGEDDDEIRDDFEQLGRLPFASDGEYSGQYRAELDIIRSRWVTNVVMLFRKDLTLETRVTFEYFVEQGRHGDL